MATREQAALLHELGLGLADAGVPTPEGGLVLAHRLDRDLGLDSMQLMRVARRLEALHGYCFSVADWVADQDESEDPDWTVGALVAWVQAKLAEAGEPGGAPPT